MTQFTIATEDAVYSYDSTESVEAKTVTIRYNLDDNASFSNTQGYLRKKQIGNKRVKARVILSDSKSRFESLIFPMIDYQDNVSCTFDRNIPFRATATMTMVLEKVNILQEFDNGTAEEIELILTEVI